MRRVLELGVPIAGENICWSLAFLVVTSFVARMGAGSLAAQSYALQITTWATLLGGSVAFGNQILVGHRIGDGDFDEAHRQVGRSLRAGLVLVVSMLAVLAALAPRLVGAFTQDPATAAAAVLLVRMGLLLETGRVSNLIVINALRAAGDARFPVLMAMASMWLVQVPLAWLLGLRFGLGLPGVWIALASDEWLRAGIMQRRWRRRAGLPRAAEPRAGHGHPTARALTRTGAFPLARPGLSPGSGDRTTHPRPARIEAGGAPRSRPGRRRSPGPPARPSWPNRSVARIDRRKTSCATGRLSGRYPNVSR